jgi:hypothetical protein
MKPVMDQQERGRTQIRTLSWVHHNFGWLFDFGCALINLCIVTSKSVITPKARRNPQKIARAQA